MSKDQPSSVLTWTASGRPATVQIPHSVIDDITVELMRGFGVTRRRGTEAGGILFGMVSPEPDRHFTILDFTVVPCEYSHGPSYILSPGDMEFYRSALANSRVGTSPIGFFRSHTRDGLYLSQEDLDLIRTNHDLPSIALVVKPYATRKPEAGIFIMEPGKLLPIEPAAPLFIFTKSTVATEVQPLPPDGAPEKEAVAATERVGSPVPTAPEAPAPRVPEPEPNREPKRDPVVTTAAAPPPRRQPPPREDLVAPELRFSAYPPAEPRPIRTILAALAFTLAAIALGGVLGYRYAGGNPRAAGAHAAERQQPGTVSAGLSASPQSDGVLLRWDLNSELVRTATRGILTITEAAGTKTVELSAAELKNGNVIYHHVGPSITFSLELHFGDRRRFTETISTAASGLGSLR